MSLVINNKLPWNSISGYNGWLSTYFSGDVDVYPSTDLSFNIIGTGDLVMRRGNINMSISSFVYAYNLNVFNNATFAKLPTFLGSNFATESFVLSQNNNSGTSISSGITINYLNTNFTTKEFLRFSISGFVNKPTTNNTIFGLNSGDGITTGANNACYGLNSGTSIVNGVRNTSLGATTLTKASAGSSNTVVGFQSFSTTGANECYFNTSLGAGTGINYLTTICGSVLVGFNVNNNYGSSTFNYATGIGFNSRCGLYSSTLGANTNNIYSYSTAIGYNATTTQDNQIVLGTLNEYVYCPNNLLVENGLISKNLTITTQADFMLNIPTYKGTELLSTQSFVVDYFYSTISNYISKNRTQSNNVISLSGYVLNTNLNSRGYATERYVINSISGLATFAYVNSQPALILSSYTTRLNPLLYGLVTISSDINVLGDLYNYGAIVSVVGDPYYNNCRYGDPLTYKSLQTSNTTYQNTALGMKNSYSLQNGFCNTSVGTYVLNNLISGNNNTCVGAGSGFGQSYCSNNTCLGANTLYQATSSNDNVAIGNNALFGLSSLQANQNVFIGANAGGFASGATICGNIAIGFNAGIVMSNARYSTCIGFNSVGGNLYGTTLGSFTNNNFSYSTVIGANAQSTDNNQITLGTRNEYVFCPSNLSISGTTYFRKLPVFSTLTTNYNMATESYVSTFFASKSNPTFTGTLTIPTLNITSDTSSTSTTTGALKVAGGVGITQDIYVQGHVISNGFVYCNGSNISIGQPIGTNIFTATIGGLNPVSVTLSSGTAKTVTSVTLTTGPWIVTFNTLFNNMSSANTCVSSISNTNNTLFDNYAVNSNFASSSKCTQCVTRLIFVSTSTASIILYGVCAFGDNTIGGSNAATCTGSLTAVKIG